MYRSLLATTLVLASTAAFAADMSADTQPGAPVVDDNRFSLTLGGGVGFQPLYEGSDEYRTVGFPIIAPSFGTTDGPRRFELRDLDDVRWHALRFDRFSIGPLAGYRFGRDESDSDTLTGMGDVDGGLVVGGFVNYDFYDDGADRFGASAAFSTQVTGDAFDDDRFASIPNFATFKSNDSYGYEIDLSLHYDAQVSDQLSFTAKAGGVYADDDYMGTYFSVTPLQATNAAALANPLPVYEAEAGFKNVYVALGTKYQVTENFDLRAGANYSRLLNDAADSPITESKDQFGGYLGAAYTFRF